MYRSLVEMPRAPRQEEGSDASRDVWWAGKQERIVVAEAHGGDDTFISVSKSSYSHRRSRHLRWEEVDER
jgi:hypothetical protein